MVSTAEIVLDPYRVAHFLAGLFSALSVVIDAVFVVVCFCGFELYEFLGYWEREDWPTRETLEFITGFFTAVILMLFLKLLGTI